MNTKINEEASCEGLFLRALFRFLFCALFFLGDNRVYERDGNEMSRCLVFGNDINTCSVFSEDEKTKWKNLFGF